MPVTFDMPPVGARMGKRWGWTQLVGVYNSVEIHRIHVKKGGFCSHHYHEHKWNRFILINGQLTVKIHRDDIDETILLPNMITDVPPKYWHEFEAQEASDALEVYWVPLDANDIVRDDEQLGGLK
jgi:mannose-6-phosphate isomerase-like protein (cupin superfamily)